jgi:hypothetical protein
MRSMEGDRDAEPGLIRHRDAALRGARIRRLSGNGRGIAGAVFNQGPPLKPSSSAARQSTAGLPHRNQPREIRLVPSGGAGIDGNVTGKTNRGHDIRASMTPANPDTRITAPIIAATIPTFFRAKSSSVIAPTHTSLVRETHNEMQPNQAFRSNRLNGTMPITS